MSRRVNSCQKGKSGEREFANLLKSMGVEARRGQQFSGSPDSPDVVSSLPVHWEIKRSQTLSIMKWYKQACDEKKEGTEPVIAFRQNGEKWLCVIDAEVLIELYRNKI